MTQYERVLRHLQDYKNITSWQSIMEYGITRLSAIIYTLRADGYNIKSEMVCTKNRYGEPTHYARYILEDK